MLFLFVQLVLLAATAQQCKEPFLGSKTLYSNKNSNTAAPKGLTAVFVNHVGRHGARHLTNDVFGSEIWQLVSKADSAGALTNDGQALKEKIKRLQKIEEKKVKSISEEGKLEQQGLAERMYKNYSAVFDQPEPVINIAYTKEIRTLQTSNAFMDELLTKIHKPSLTKKINDTTLRFYDLSPAYLQYKKKGSWTESLAQLKNSLHYNDLAKTIAGRFFTKEWIARLTEQDLDEFTSGLFGFISITYSIQEEIKEAGYINSDLDMTQYLDCKQLQILRNIDNAEDFLLKGPANNLNGIQVSIAAPLLDDFIKTTDDYIANKSTQAQLRFSHAETIAPFAAILSLTTAAKTTNDPASIQKLWDAGEVIPLSSNIQWILYRKNGTDKYMIKFLLNEKETAVIGLTTKTFPYYEWSAVKKFYSKKLENLKFTPGENYYDYLQKVQ